jgi:hypothetical protein
MPTDELTQVEKLAHMSEAERLAHRHNLGVQETRRAQTYLKEFHAQQLRDVAQPTTYLNFARAFADDESGGRFAPLNKHKIEAVPSYPAQPEGRPWRSNPMPIEEPLGYSVNQMEPVGTPSEIARSIEAVAVADPLPLAPQVGGVDRTATASTFKRKLRHATP